MSRKIFALLVLLVAAGASSSGAQERVFSIAVSGGLAGSLDEDEGGFSNATFQGRFAVETARRRLVSVRLGRMDFDGEPLGGAFDATVDYLTVAGEYLFDESYYESGLYAGLGLFDLASTRFDGRPGDETAVGLVVGALGEFRLTDRWFVYGEAGFAYTNLELAQLFADLQLGVGFRF